MRVLHVSQPTQGGVAVYVAQAVADQVSRGWDVAVACPPYGDLATRLHAMGVVHVPWDAARSPGAATMSEVGALRRIVQGLAPHVLHLHSSKAGLAGRLIPRDVPTIFQPHGWSWLAATGFQASAVLAWERFAARFRTDALVCVGAGELRQGRLARVRGPYRLVRNGVDLSRFTPATGDDRMAARARLGIAHDVPLAVCIGRVTRQKGQDILLDAWPMVRERCPQALLAIVGDGEDLPRLQRGAPGVRFVPPVADTREWLAAANVVVLPSRWEGLPLVALEALARGRSMVCSDIPGLDEVVPDGTGALVPSGNPGALAAALAFRLSRPAHADAEGRAGAEAAAEHDLARTLDLLATVTAGLAARKVPYRPQPSEGSPGTATLRAGNSR